MSLSRLSAINPPIREPLPLDLAKGFDSALSVVHALRGAVRVAEVKPLQVALKMRFRNVVVGAVDAALQQPKVGLNGVAVDSARTRIFASRVVGGLVRGELVGKAHVLVV